MGILLGALTQSTSAAAFVCMGLLNSRAITFPAALSISAWTGVGTSVLVFLASIDLRLAALGALALVAVFYLAALHRHESGKRSAELLISIGLTLLGPQAQAQPAPVVLTNPADAGLSAERVARITAAFNKEITDKALPGVTIMVARKGKLVYSGAFGLRDPAKPEPVAVDSLFRIYSMIKPFTAVAAMMLVEEGKLQLSDAVAKHPPAFKDMQALTSTGTEPARPMTVSTS